MKPARLAVGAIACCPLFDLTAVPTLGSVATWFILAVFIALTLPADWLD